MTRREPIVDPNQFGKRPRVPPLRTRGPGRPDQGLSHSSISVRLDAQRRSALYEIAEADGVTAGEVVRRLLDGAIARRRRPPRR